MIALTTGRQTNQKLNALLKDLSHAIPDTRIMRRGKSSIDDLLYRALESDFKKAIVLQRWHGGPGRMDFYEVNPSGMVRLPPSLRIRGVRLKREYGPRGSPIVRSITLDPHIGVDGKRLGQALSTIINVPISNSPTESAGSTSLHVSENENGIMQVAVISSSKEIGPRLMLERIVWESDEEGT